MSSTQALPNPDVYLNHIPPATASQFEVSRNIYLVTLGAFVWDLLSSSPEDIYLLRHFNSNTIPFFLSRVTALLYVLLSVVAKNTNSMAATPGPDCVKIEHAITSCWVVSMGTSSFLFLRRVIAVFPNSRFIRALFIFLWFATIGTSVTVPIGSHISALGTTRYCINGGIERYVGLTAGIMTLVFDSLVFLVISYKILTTHTRQGEEWSWRTIYSTLPRLSRALFRGGQQYYLITVGINIILVLVLVTTPTVPPIYQATFTVPEVALTSSMACRVYRNLYFKARFPSTSTNDTEMSLRFANGHQLGDMTAQTEGTGYSRASSNTKSTSDYITQEIATLRVDLERDNINSSDIGSCPNVGPKPKSVI